MLTTAEGELAAVGKYLRSLSKAEVTKLGIQMGLSYKWLKDVKSSGTYRYDLVDAWLKEQNSVAEVCPPTWQNFVATLREVNQDDIADRVTKEKGTHRHIHLEFIMHHLARDCMIHFTDLYSVTHVC